MKKTVLSIISLILILCLLAPTAFAFTPEDNDLDPVDPEEYTRVTYLYAALSINSSGVATCSGTVIPTHSTDTVTFTMRLQYHDGTTWRNYRTWSTVGGGSPIDLDKTAVVSSNYTYYRVRVSAECVSASGNASETVYANSSIKTYP